MESILPARRVKSSARIKTKAGHGLASIPQTADEWRISALEHGLEQRTLSDLCLKGSFSASTTPGDSFLTIRAYWPQRERFNDALQGLVETGTFFSRQQADSAKHILENEKLGLAKIDMFSDLVHSQDQTHTPEPTKGSLGESLGSFSSLVSLYNLLKGLDGRSHHLGEDGPTRRFEDAPRINRFYDPNQHQQACRERSPLYTYSRSDHSKPLNPSEDEVTDATNDSEDGGEGLWSATEGILNPTSPLPVPKQRTPDETIVVDFLVNLIAAVATQIQPISRRPVCMADAVEKTFQFGPISGASQMVSQDPENGSKNKGKTTGRQKAEGAEEKGGPRTSGQDVRPAAFCARVDGGIPKSRTSDGNRLAVVFEAKRDHRSHRNDVQVRVQQTMEHVALIWENHKGYKPQAPEKLRTTPQKRHHTVMIAQDLQEIFISYGAYEDAYLDYLFGPGCANVIPPNTDTIPCLAIQEFGPFYIYQEKHLKQFVIIILALLIWQLQDVHAGKLVEDALRDMDADSDDEDTSDEVDRDDK